MRYKVRHLNASDDTRIAFQRYGDADRKITLVFPLIELTLGSEQSLVEKNRKWVHNAILFDNVREPL